MCLSGSEASEPVTFLARKPANCSLYIKPAHHWLLWVQFYWHTMPHPLAPTEYCFLVLYKADVQRGL